MLIELIKTINTERTFYCQQGPSKKKYRQNLRLLLSLVQSGVKGEEKPLWHIPVLIFSGCKYNYNYDYVSVFLDTSRGDSNAFCIMLEHLKPRFSKMIFSGPRGLWLNEWVLGCWFPEIGPSLLAGVFYNELLSEKNLFIPRKCDVIGNDPTLPTLTMLRPFRRC